MLWSLLPPSFLDTYSLSMSCIGCKVLFIVISFLVLWFIYWNSSLVCLKNGSEYLTRRTAQVFISLMRYLLAWFGLFFSFSWDTKFLFFLSSPLIWWYPLSILPSTCNFPFLIVFWFFSWFGSIYLPLCEVSRFSWAWRLLLCRIPSPYPDSIFSLPVFGFPVLFYFCQKV